MSLADRPLPTLPHPTGGLPPLRLVPAPCWEPPYDDERDPDAEETLQAPSLRLVVPPVPPAPLTAVPSPPSDDEDDEVDADERESERRRRTPVDALPPARRFAHAVLQRLVEVDAGVRPLGQLERDLTMEAFEALAARYTRNARPTGPRPTAASVRSIHVQTRPEGVAEVCGTVLRGRRPIAVALRLEGRDGSWRCTDLVGI